MLCQKCHKREATETWSDEGIIAFVHGFIQKWCKPCVLEEQLKYARERAAKIPELEKELKDTLQALGETQEGGGDAHPQ